MGRPPFPANLREFQRQFTTEEACQRYLAACRWPQGFRCPRCGHERAYAMLKHGRWRCAACRYQVSLTAGTILHHTKIPLTVWFWAAYLMTTDKRGISAVLLQRQLGLSRYETAWMLLQKLQRANGQHRAGATAGRGGDRRRHLNRWAAARPPGQPSAQRPKGPRFGSDPRNTSRIGPSRHQVRSCATALGVDIGQTKVEALRNVRDASPSPLVTPANSIRWLDSRQVMQAKLAT